MKFIMHILQHPIIIPPPSIALCSKYSTRHLPVTHSQGNRPRFRSLETEGNIIDVICLWRMES